MDRRRFVKSLTKVGAFGLAGVAASSLAWYNYFDGPVFNPCMSGKLPQHLWDHELMQLAFENVDPTNLWDCHFHLIGNGLKPSIDSKPSGVWLSPNMSSYSSPLQRLQYSFYMNAGCIQEPEHADKIYLQNINRLNKQLPAGVRFMLLAFDYHYDDNGQVDRDMSTFYVPNEYAARIAGQFEHFEWIASIHPYREDALEELEWCAAHGARAVKWLPPAMNIDPSSKRCEKFYDKLVSLNIPLLTHAGEEKAVHSEELQVLSNPLLLRKPLDRGVKVIVAHCASLGENEDLDSKSRKMTSNFELFSRLMNEPQYGNNLKADISAINLFNRDIDEIRKLLKNQHWHSRLLYASDFPLPGVIPIISVKNLVSHGLLKPQQVSFLNEVRQYNSWLFDFLVKRFMAADGVRFADECFATRGHFVD
ncbi:amidohydrolase family protein [Aliikangiella sp. G2MR2-5]|uniref:amidohydrolase family protein n=1 Tax=Aliikangiella sp. G2MR2-5 TaxID=2788943 RepID=UPI0018AC3EDE|nr:amidohydrolase family protein [Aliikangiella sp. G2MR2-5]